MYAAMLAYGRPCFETRTSRYKSAPRTIIRRGPTRQDTDLERVMRTTYHRIKKAYRDMITMHLAEHACMHSALAALSVSIYSVQWQSGIKYVAAVD